MAEAVRAGDVDAALLDAQARRLLSVFERVGAFEDAPDQVEESVDRPEHRAVARRAACVRKRALGRRAGSRRGGGGSCQLA